MKESGRSRPERNESNRGLIVSTQKYIWEEHEVGHAETEKVLCGWTTRHRNLTDRQNQGSNGNLFVAGEASSCNCLIPLLYNPFRQIWKCLEEQSALSVFSLSLKTVPFLKTSAGMSWWQTIQFHQVQDFQPHTVVLVLDIIFYVNCCYFLNRWHCFL